MTRIDAVYFTMTTMSTVGYGNVAPESQLCRLVASWQMLFTMVFVAVFFGLLVAVLSSQLKRPE
ncbi:MAG TPA: potassium channel family protein [Acidimicrobiales bacterium]|nr:potassium channel family protein [Acidimicrobiales bacterium]